MLGLESAFAVVMTTLVEPGLVTLDTVARIMSTTPAEIGRVSGYDTPLTVGQPAHLTVVHPAGLPEQPHGSLSSNNPYRDQQLVGRVMHTFYSGVQTVNDSQLVELGEKAL